MSNNAWSIKMNTHLNINSLPEALNQQFSQLIEEKIDGEKSLKNYQIEGWGLISVTMQRIFDQALIKKMEDLKKNGAQICGGAKLCTDQVIVEAPENVEMLNFVKQHFSKKEQMIFGPSRRQFDVVTINGMSI
jgi:hypothetical protein